MTRFSDIVVAIVCTNSNRFEKNTKSYLKEKGLTELLHLAGESVPLDEQTTNAKDNRNSQVFESLALLAPSQPAVSDKERKKFEDEKSKLYIQLDEKVS